ncbi:MAG: DUF2812 domain-containing protein [Anaerolineaceae bacterium]|nr:DUF2812 domain-containing protein [Anaerolineaceae bacterium]
MEKKTVSKWFWVWQFEDEEAWLNEMAANGWVLDSVGFCRYHFVRCEPGAYNVRTEMHPYDESYVKFMEETGAEYVGRMMMWVYFRKKTEDGVFNLYSDIDSRISHLDRIAKMLTAIGGANLVIGVINSISFNSRFGWINILCATILMYCLGRIHGKKEALEKERELHE